MTPLTILDRSGSEIALKTGDALKPFVRPKVIPAQVAFAGVAQEREIERITRSEASMVAIHGCRPKEQLAGSEQDNSAADRLLVGVSEPQLRGIPGAAKDCV